MCQIQKFSHYILQSINVTVYGKTGHNAACVRSIDFLKMYCFKPAEGNSQVYYSGNDLSYDDRTWRAQYLDADNSVSAKKNFSKVAALCLVFLQTVTNILILIINSKHKPKKLQLVKISYSFSLNFLIFILSFFDIDRCLYLN